jgi:hypothetical protein
MRHRAAIGLLDHSTAIVKSATHEVAVVKDDGGQQVCSSTQHTV